MIWTYYVCPDVLYSKLQATLNDLGSKGWELVTLFPAATGKLDCIFKRQSSANGDKNESR
jgi:hypothetical protein